MFLPCLLFVYDLLKRMKAVIYSDALVGVFPVNGCDDFTNGSNELRSHMFCYEEGGDIFM